VSSRRESHRFSLIQLPIFDSLSGISSECYRTVPLSTSFSDSLIQTSHPIRSVLKSPTLHHILLGPITAHLH